MDRNLRLAVDGEEGASVPKKISLQSAGSRRDSVDGRGDARWISCDHSAITPRNSRVQDWNRKRKRGNLIESLK